MQRQLFKNMFWSIELYRVSDNRPFEGSHEADVALGENEFDTPGIAYSKV